MGKKLLLFMGLFFFLFGCRLKSSYQKKNGVWYYDDVSVDVTKADRFTPLTGRFARTTSHGYYRGKIIDESDGQSFEVVSDHYAKDKANVFYCDTYRKGQEYYFYKYNRTLKVKNADAATFNYIDQEYARDKNAVYFEGVAFSVKDVDSFQVLNYGFAKDRFTAYYDQIPIEGSDGATFEALDNNYSKDKKNIYYSGFIIDKQGNRSGPVSHVVKGADLATFTTATGVTDSVDASDKNARYKDGKKLR
jgi:DKNYY family